MELYFRSLFGLHVHSCTHWLSLRPRNPAPRILAHFHAAPLGEAMRFQINPRIWKMINVGARFAGCGVPTVAEVPVLAGVKLLLASLLLLMFLLLLA